METAENSTIQQKINSVTDLPHGYTPNLQSKWDLLEAGLNKQERKTSLFYFRYISGIAAALLLIGGAGLYIIKNNKPVTKPAAQQTQPLFSVKEPIINEGIPATDKSITIKQKSANRINKTILPVKAEMSAEIIVQTSDSVVYSIPSEEVQPALVSNKKASRFVELDFNEPVITDQAPSQVVVESKRFRFRIGSGNESNAGVESSGTSFFRFRKAFN